VGLGLFAVLAAFAAADPVTKVTDSVAPFTDEAFNVVNAPQLRPARGLEHGRVELHLVNLPFSLLEALIFRLIGVGDGPRRAWRWPCVSRLRRRALVWGLRGAVGRVCATFAGVAFGASGLILFYRPVGLPRGHGRPRTDARHSGAGAREPSQPARRGPRGICYAVAIGTKPSALFSVVGILFAMGLVWGWRDRATRHWIVGSTAVIAIAGLIWAIAIWLPNQAAVAIDVKIWPPYQWNLTPVELFNSIKAYLTGKSDHIFGVMLLPLIALGCGGPGLRSRPCASDSARRRQVWRWPRSPGRPSALGS